MKVHLATASLAEVQWARQHGLLDGVITTPSLLLAESAGDQTELLRDLCRTAGVPVFVTVHAISGDDVYRDAREIARLSDQIIVQVPLMEDSIGAIHRLTADGIHVAATLVFNAAQALLAARAGASSVITPVDHLDAVGHDGVEIVRELRAVFDASDTECDVIAMRPTTASQLARCALARAHAVALSHAVLRSLLVHPLTDRGIDQFLHDIARHRPS